MKNSQSGWDTFGGKVSDVYRLFGEKILPALNHLREEASEPAILNEIAFK